MMLFACTRVPEIIIETYYNLHRKFIYKEKFIPIASTISLYLMLRSFTSRKNKGTKYVHSLCFTKSREIH